MVLPCPCAAEPGRPPAGKRASPRYGLGKAGVVASPERRRVALVGKQDACELGSVPLDDERLIRQPIRLAGPHR